MRDNLEPFAARKHNCRFGKMRRADDVGRNSRGNGIKAKCAKEIPRRRLPCIVVAGESIRAILIEGSEDIVDVLLGLGSRTGKVVEIRDVMAGLVALVVETALKQFIQFGDERGVSMLHLDQSGNVLQHIKGKLKWHPLGHEGRRLRRINGEIHVPFA